MSEKSQLQSTQSPENEVKHTLNPVDSQLKKTIMIVTMKTINFYWLCMMCS